MRLFIAGISGLLGLNFARQTRDRFQVSGGYFSHPISLEGVQAVKLDTTDPNDAERVLSTATPDLIVNTVALTNVDECESNPSLAQRLNVDSAKIVASLAQRLNIRLVHISTDHLFDGTASELTETDVPSPINNYAATKRSAELSVQEACPDALIVRTNFYGLGTSTRPSFTDWIVRGLEAKRKLTMFTDVFFTPILIDHLVELIIELADSGASGVFNVPGAERVSKHDFALKTADVFGYSDHNIVPTSVGDLQFQAPRPQDMSLSSAKIEKHLGKAMPGILVGLERLKELGGQGVAAEMEAAFSGSRVNSP